VNKNKIGKGDENKKKGRGMMKKHFIFLIIVLVMFSFLISQERGLKVVRTPQGDAVTLYKGSYALIVGNGNYSAGWDPLSGSLKDVEEIAAVLQRNGFQVTLIKDANKEKFLSAFSDFTFNFGQEKDNQLLFYYAGHGCTQTLAGGQELGYLVMVDSPLPEGKGNRQRFDDKSVDMEAIVTIAKKMKSKHVLFMFDCCFSGTILNFRSRVIPTVITDAVKYPVRQFITAGRGNEAVPDKSVFKQLFVEILEGKRDEPMPDGYLTGEELGLFLKNNVPEFNNYQHPQYGKIRDPNLDKGDFVFVLNKASTGKPGDAQVSTVPTNTSFYIPTFQVTITSFPGNAKVSIDGKEVGETPFNKKIEKGMHKIEVNKEGFKPEKDVVDISSDYSKKYNLIEAGFGYVLISFFPYAKVEIDGKEYREVPPPLEVRLPAGKHKIRFFSPRLGKEKTIEIDLLKGERKRIHEKGELKNPG